MNSPQEKKLTVCCAWVIASLDKYASDELLPSDRVAVEQHLCHCPSCADEAEAYGEIVRSAESLPPILPPPDVERRLRNFLAEALRATDRSSPLSSADGTTFPLK